MANTIQLRRGSASAWTAANSVLAEGEIGIELDTNKFKIGSGTASWNEINYFSDTSINTQTGTSYTLALSDSNKLVEMNSASANIFIIPSNSNVAFPTGTKIDVIQIGSGQTTASADSGVTINSKEGNLNLTGQWSAVSIVKRGTDEWTMIGDLSA